MGLRKRLFNLASYEYAFLVSFIILIGLVVGLFAAFFPASIARIDGDPHFTLVFAVIAIQPVAFLSGYFGAYHNVASPYSNSLPIGPVLGVVGFALYAGTTGALLTDRLTTGYGDGILILLMTYGFFKFGWWTYTRHWRSFGLSEA